MKEVTRVTLKGFSGYGPYDEGYTDKLTLTQDFVSYECIPNFESDVNPHIKWKYSTNNQMFKNVFKDIASLVEETLSREIDVFCTDIGGIEFTLIYLDKTKVKRHYWLPADYFYDIIKLIKMLVPPTENMPVILLTEDDFLVEE